MLRSLLRLLSNSPQRPSPIVTGKQVLLYARVDNRAETGSVSSRSDVATRPPTEASHRERLLSMRLEHTNLCSPRRSARLRDLGVVTAGDLSLADPHWLARQFGAPRKALAVIKQYRRAIRFAAAVPGMMPRDALLLISIHRRSVRGLASESPAALHRDLERFAESTKGRLQLRGRRIPSTRRLKRWIAQCESSVIRPAVSARAA